MNMKKILLFFTILLTINGYSQITIENSGNNINIIRGSDITLSYAKENIDIIYHSRGQIFFRTGIDVLYNVDYTEIDSPVTVNINDLIDTLTNYRKNYITVPLESNGAVPVNIQDQHTPILIGKFNQITNSDTLTSTTVIDQTYIVVDDTTGSANSDMIVVFSDVTNRVYFGSALSFNIDTIFLDTPFDSDFPVGSDVDFTITNMAVDGSATPQVFGLRGSGMSSPIAVEFDITRIIFKCTTSNAVDLSKFVNLAKLTKGLVLRKRDGTYQNLFNVKDNGELAGLMYDFTVYSSTNPQQGIDGFVARLTFAGQSKIGVTVRLSPGEDLEFIVQDDLLTAQSGETITLLEVIAEGHIVTD